MKTDKSIRFLLTVIAINLTLLTISELDLLPKAYANEINPTLKSTHVNYGLIPLNSDSTITVRFTDQQLNLLRRPLTNTVQDVNLIQINGKRPCTFDAWRGTCAQLYVDAQ